MKIEECKDQTLKIMVGTGLDRNNVSSYSLNNFQHILPFIHRDELLEFAHRDDVIAEANRWVKSIRARWTFTEKRDKRRCLPMVLASVLIHGNRWSYDHRYLPAPFNNQRGRERIDRWLDMDDEYHEILLETYDRIKWKGE